MSNNFDSLFVKFGFKKHRSGDSEKKTSSSRRLQTDNNNNNNIEEYKQRQEAYQRELFLQQQQQQQQRLRAAKKKREILYAKQKQQKQQKQQQQQTMNTKDHKHQTINSSTTQHRSSRIPSNHSSSSSTKQRSKSSRSTKQHHPNGAFAHLDPKAFTQNMNESQIQKLMGLRKAPSYKTDEKGYIEFQPGLFIRNNFVLLDTLGRGTFSKVFEAVDCMDQTKIAIKVIRNTHRYIEAAKTELRVLQHITNTDDGRSSCIHLKDHFSWNNHPCFVFKLYGPSIYTVMSRNRFRAFPDCISRSLTFQICNAIQFLHHLGIIFTDLKPENMVFIDGRTYPVKIHGKTHLLPLDTRIKIVDFGSAVYEPRYDENNPKTWKFKDGYNYLIQTRHYRAPEVVLEMPWKRPVDVWSVGCVILEFLYGSMVFNTHCPIDHLNQMQKMIGALPRDLIRRSSEQKYKQLFHHTDGRLRLEDARRSRAQAKRLDTYFNLHKLEHRQLYDLVSRCLKWRSNERISGHALIKHEYFSFIKNILTHQHKFVLSSKSTSSSSSSSSSTTQQQPVNNNNKNKNNHQPQKPITKNQ